MWVCVFERGSELGVSVTVTGGVWGGVWAVGMMNEREEGVDGVD